MVLTSVTERSVGAAVPPVLLPFSVFAAIVTKSALETTPSVMSAEAIVDFVASEPRPETSVLVIANSALACVAVMSTGSAVAPVLLPLRLLAGTLASLALVIESSTTMIPLAFRKMTSSDSSIFLLVPDAAIVVSETSTASIRSVGAAPAPVSAARAVSLVPVGAAPPPAGVAHVPSSLR